MQSECHQRDGRAKIFALDLFYPAVLGSLIVLIFLRIAYLGWHAMEVAGTYFGIVLAFFFSLGFVHSKLSDRYNGLLAIIDCLTALGVFWCFYLLGFNEFERQGISDVTTKYAQIYLITIALAAVPAIRRIASGDFRLLDRRNLYSVGAAIVLLLGILNEGLVTGFTWAVPGLVVTALAVLAFLSAALGRA